jgi:hypothetical protein
MCWDEMKSEISTLAGYCVAANEPAALSVRPTIDAR